MNYRRYSSTQVKYAATYVLITAVVLLFLNLYTSDLTQKLFYQSKQSAMTEKCLLASDEIAKLEVINASTASSLVEQLESLTVTRMIVTDQNGFVIYDSAAIAQNQYCLLPEIVTAMEGNDVFSWNFHDAVMESRAAAPIIYFGSTVGCVYITDYDATQGAMLSSLQNTILRVTLALEAVVLLFSLAYAATFSRRIHRLMASMRIIQNGDYTHKVDMGGNDELTLLGNEFNDLTERLQTSEQKRRRFVSDASHELKTPLASIKLLTDSILQNEMDSATIREFVCDIGDEADRLNRMTAKLLSLTRVDVDENAECEIIYMEPTVRRAVRRLSTLTERNCVTIHVNSVQDVPILMQEDDLYQIVYNLLENGIKYNIPNGEITVTLGQQNDNALLTVRDTGVGIPEDALGHIFERFFRVDKARSRQSGGSGLGLAIVRAIVQRNRGEITVESTVGAGTTFHVTFPIFDTEVDQE